MPNELYTEDPPVELEMNLTLSPDDITIVVPFPEGHPMTALRKATPEIAELLMSWSEAGVMLHSLYVYTHPNARFQGLATAQERRATVGLGRRMLCLACTSRAAWRPRAALFFRVSFFLHCRVATLLLGLEGTCNKWAAKKGVFLHGMAQADREVTDEGRERFAVPRCSRHNESLHVL